MCPAPTLDVEDDLGDLSDLPPFEAVSVICVSIIAGLPTGLKGRSSCTCLYNGKRYTFDESHDPAVIQQWLTEGNVISLADHRRAAVDNGRE